MCRFWSIVGFGLPTSGALLAVGIDFGKRKHAVIVGVGFGKASQRFFESLIRLGRWLVGCLDS